MGGVERIKTKPKQLLPISELIGKVGSAGKGLIQSKIDADSALSIDNYRPDTLYHKYHDFQEILGLGGNVPKRSNPALIKYNPRPTGLGGARLARPLTSEEEDNIEKALKKTGMTLAEWYSRV